MITFRFNSRTIKRVKLVSKCGYQSATRCSNSLHMYLGYSAALTPLKIFVKICEHTCTKVIHIVFSTWEQGFETSPAGYPSVECRQSDGATGALHRKDRVSLGAPDASTRSDRTLAGHVRSG